MMKSNGLGYAVSQAFRYFWSNKVMSFASIGVLACCLFIMCSFCLVSLNLNNNIKDLEAENEIVCFIDDSVDEEGIARIGASLQEIDNVADAVFISKEEALQDYTEQFESNAELFSILDENPLRNSYSVTFHSIELFDETLERISGIEGIAKIRSRQDVVDGLLSLGSTVSTVSFWIMALLFLSSLFIIVNTIKLARHAYRKQINIMKYIGATDWFIRWPFIIEGGIIGLFAGALAFFMVWYTYLALLEKIAIDSFLFAILPFSSVFYPVLGALLGGGVFIGVLGSAITIRKYLDV